MEPLLIVEIRPDFIKGALWTGHGAEDVISTSFGVPLKDRGMGEVIAEVSSSLPASPAKCRISLSPELVAFRNIHLPFTDRQKIAKVLPLEIEEQTAFDHSEIHIDFLVRKGENGGAGVLVAMVERDWFTGLLAAFRENGIDPEIVTVNGLETVIGCTSYLGILPETFLTIDLSASSAILVLVENGQVVTLRTIVSGHSSQDDQSDRIDQNITKEDNVNLNIIGVVKGIGQTLLSIGRSELVRDETPCYVNGPDYLLRQFQTLCKSENSLKVCDYHENTLPDLKEILKNHNSADLQHFGSMQVLATVSKNNPNLMNFRKGDFRISKSLRQYWKIGLIAALVCFAGIAGIILYSWQEYRQLQIEKLELKNEIVEVFNRAVPGVARVVSPVRQLRVRVEDAQGQFLSGANDGSVSVVTLLAELSHRIPPAMPVKITRFVKDEKSLRIKGETNGFNTVDSLKKRLIEYQHFTAVDISSANLAPDGDGVQFELKIEFGPAREGM